MPAKKLLSVFVFVAVGFLAWAASAPAQSSGTAQKKSLIDRLDDFGKTIFGGIVPVEKPSARASAAMTKMTPWRKPSPPRGPEA